MRVDSAEGAVRMMSAMAECPNAELQRLRSVLDAASDAYLCVDTAGQVVDCNRAAEELFDLSRSELIGAVSPESVAPLGSRDEYRLLHQRMVATASGGSQEPLEIVIARSEGVEARLEVSTWAAEHDGRSVIHALCRDVTDRSRLHEEAVEHARQLNEAQALARVGSWEWDLTTDALVWSEQLYRLFGLEQGTPVAYSAFLDRLHPEDREWVQTEIDAAALAGSPLDYEARIVRTDGVVRWIAAHGATATDGEGVPVRVAGTAHDITERKLGELELERVAVTDALTGLANRSRLERRHEVALDECRRNGEPLALLMIDLDGFKPVNDTHGHPVGDAVLVEISRRFAACTRPGDTLARVGGDEFALLLPGSDRDAATGVARRLVDAASAPVVIDESTSLSVGASVGIAICERRSISGVGELRRQADRAMYTAKRSGRGRHVVFTPELVVTGTESLLVRVQDAREWATYMTAVRAEIARCKASGLLPQAARAPATVTRTLESLLAAITQLPREQEHARLPLPERIQLEEFVFHQSMVHDWVDLHVERGVLTERRTTRADTFWRRLQAAMATTR